jgi:hypothetical protein
MAIPFWFAESKHGIFAVRQCYMAKILGNHIAEDILIEKDGTRTAARNRLHTLLPTRPTENLETLTWSKRPFWLHTDSRYRLSQPVFKPILSRYRASMVRSLFPGFCPSATILSGFEIKKIGVQAKNKP